MVYGYFHMIKWLRLLFQVILYELLFLLLQVILYELLPLLYHLSVFFCRFHFSTTIVNLSQGISTSAPWLMISSTCMRRG